jgi:hypothetical protein
MGNNIYSFEINKAKLVIVILFSCVTAVVLSSSAHASTIPWSWADGDPSVYETKQSPASWELSLCPTVYSYKYIDGISLAQKVCVSEGSPFQLGMYLKDAQLGCRQLIWWGNVSF